MKRVFLVGPLLAVSVISTLGRAQPYVGKAKVSVTATVSYDTYARTFNPTFDVTMSAIPGTTKRTVDIVDNQFTTTYECTLVAGMQNTTLEFTTPQTCKLAISTPDFCMLKQTRCDSGQHGLHCSSEKAAGNLGTLNGELKSGLVQSGGNNAWQLTLKFVASGCVLVEGRNDNRPIDVRGGVIRVVTP